MKTPPIRPDSFHAPRSAGVLACGLGRRLVARGWRLLLVLFCGVMLAGNLSETHAAPPEFMTYQGFLVDANGNPLAPNTPANYPVIFRIFTASIGGTRLWSEQQIVTVDKGHFSVLLGEGTPVGGEQRPLLSSVFAGPNSSDRFMGISVTIGTTTSEMLPRLQLLPAPYAFLATSASSVVQPNGAPVLSYANSRVEVNGSFFTSGTISGNGSGLTGLTAAHIGSGTFADARLSPNVALRAGGNAFTGDQTIAGNVGIGGPPPVDAVLDVEGNARLNTHDLFLRGGGDRNHGLGWFGTFGVNKPFGGLNVDGPVLYGFSGGGLGIRNGGDRLAVRWDIDGKVGIGHNNPSGKLTVNGGVLARDGAPGSGGANDNGYAFTGNANSGMFSGGQDVEFYVGNREQMRVTANGNVGINTANPTARLDVNGDIRATGLTVNGNITATAFNGEKAPMTFTVPAALPGNLASWRQVLVDTSTLLGDADGGRIKVIARNHANRTVRTYSIEFYAEQDSDFSKPQADGRYFWTVNSYGGEAGDQLIGRGGAFRTDIASVPWGWVFIRNYSTGLATGTGDGNAFGFADRYKFYFLVAPNVTATVFIYDR